MINILRWASWIAFLASAAAIVIGGLISKEDSYGFNKIPFLGDLPLIGAAFRYKETDKLDRELLIFITPNISKRLHMSWLISLNASRKGQKQ